MWTCRARYQLQICRYKSPSVFCPSVEILLLWGWNEHSAVVPFPKTVHMSKTVWMACVISSKCYKQQLCHLDPCLPGTFPRLFQQKWENFLLLLLCTTGTNKDRQHIASLQLHRNGSFRSIQFNLHVCYETLKSYHQWDETMSVNYVDKTLSVPKLRRTQNGCNLATRALIWLNLAALQPFTVSLPPPRHQRFEVPPPEVVELDCWGSPISGCKTNRTLFNAGRIMPGVLTGNQ